VPDCRKVNSSKGRAARSAKNPRERTAKKSGTSHPNNPPPTIIPTIMEFRKELNSPRSVVSANVNAHTRAIANNSFPKKGERGKRCAKVLKGSGAKSAMRCLMAMARPRRRAMMGSMPNRLQARGRRLQEKIHRNKIYCSAFSACVAAATSASFLLRPSPMPSSFPSQMTRQRKYLRWAFPRSSKCS
jgi:hypothetical protein